MTSLSRRDMLSLFSFAPFGAEDTPAIAGVLGFGHLALAVARQMKPWLLPIAISRAFLCRWLHC